MTTIGLIRHGITNWNMLEKAQGDSDIPLNDTGKRQAKLLGHRLSKEKNWEMIITSDLTRAVETGKIIGRKLNLTASYIDKRIREIDCGEIEGTTEEERIEQWGRNWRQLELGIEKFADVSKRGLEFLEDVIQVHNGKRILVVSHGALIGLTLQKLLPQKFKTTNINNTAVTILTNTNGVWDCLLYNCTNHLGEKWDVDYL